MPKQGEKDWTIRAVKLDACEDVTDVCKKLIDDLKSTDKKIKSAAADLVVSYKDKDYDDEDELPETTARDPLIITIPGMLMITHISS